ncbi:MAG: hypothetical protein V4463_03625 [Pseudomonadota bacterium]
MKTRTRPLQASILSALFLLAAAAMIALSLDAHAYFITTPSLLACAALAWSGRRLAWFKRLLELNQLTAIILILDLWLGDMLHLPKLAISASMLAANLVLGGPLMGILAIIALCCLLFGQSLRAWFQSPQA